MAYVIEIRGLGSEGLGRTTRLWIKSSMEQFGEVAQVRKPPTSGVPETDVAFVHFTREDAAGKAVAFLKTGAELNDGTPVKGDWKSGSRGVAKGPGKGGRSWMDKDAPVDSRSLAMGRDMTSRDLHMSGRERQKSRSRSRSRRGRRSPSRRDKGRRKSRSRSRKKSSSRDRDRGRRRDDSRSARRDRSRDRKRDSRSRGRKDDRKAIKDIKDDGVEIIQSTVSVPPPVEQQTRVSVPPPIPPVDTQPEPMPSGNYPPEVEEALRRARLAMHGFVQVDQSQIDQYQS